MTVAEIEVTGLLAEPYSELLEQPDELGEEVVLRLRVPHAARPGKVVLRYVRDGEAQAVVAEPDGETDTETWWRASFTVDSPTTRYRWLLSGGVAGYSWVNGLGRVDHDVPDADDFVLAPGAGGPDWHLRSVVYEIFPDRFASSGNGREAPGWAVWRDWDDLPTGRGRDTPHELYGGDLRGIEQHLDHIERLGANLIYLTPFFPAESIHRYDSTTFEHVDPLLGGDEALAALTAAAHARGLRVIGDLTLNHTGHRHEWFVAAQSGPEAPEREFFFFDESLPHGYASWYGVPVLPKLDHASPELGARLADVATRWLQPPYELDGWRIDVANMAGRHRGVDLNHALARATRRAIEEIRPDAVLVGEHAHDFRGDLGGDGWHGTMNYAGFLRPVWCWLRGDLPEELRHSFWGFPVGLPSFDGTQAVATMRAFRAGVPWPSTLHSWALLDSHDTARFRTVAGSRERQLVGVGLQMTSPGVPMIFAGDELGLEGEWGEDARRTMPWDRRETWDTALLESYRELIALRRSSEALARGDLRYAYVGEDAIAYLREHGYERLLCLAARASHEPVRLPLAGLGCGGLEALYGDEAAYEGGEVVLPGDGPAFHIWKLT